MVLTRAGSQAGDTRLKLVLPSHLRCLERTWSEPHPFLYPERLSRALSFRCKSSDLLIMGQMQIPCCCCCCLGTKSCLTLVTWTVALQAPLSLGFPRREHRSGLPFPPPGGQVSKPRLLYWQVDSLPLSHQESPHITWIISEKINNPETLKPWNQFLVVLNWACLLNIQQKQMCTLTGLLLPRPQPQLIPTNNYTGLIDSFNKKW